MNKKQKDNSGWGHLIAAASGLALGVWATREHIAKAKKSRAEIDDPETAEDIMAEIGKLLDQWEPEDYENENGFAEDLAHYLDENSDWEIELRPNGREGIPDILVEDILAIELKLSPNKGEQDRAIGQCAGYSREWITWLVLIGTPASQTGRVERLLQDKGLEQIAVWSFN